jgi:hypothetical protein
LEVEPHADALWGLPLILVPKVPVGNAEYYRVQRSHPADFAKFPVRSETAVIPAEIARNALSKTTSLTLFFSGNSNVSHGTGTEPQSRTCEDGIRVAQEKHHVSTGTLGTEIKP